MDVERLPSGKFATNKLVLELMILSYNILRMMDQETIGREAVKTNYIVRRRRLCTVIGNLIMKVLLKEGDSPVKIQGFEKA